MWDLQTALSQPGQLQPGDIVWLHSGVYAGPFTSYLNGTPERPIVVRGYPGEPVVIDGGDSRGSPILTIKGSYTRFWGMEIMSSAGNKISSQSTSWPTDIPYGEGIVIDQGGTAGTGSRFINLDVHDTRQEISSWKEAEGAEVDGCLLYDNGWIAPDRPHGHTMYVQTSSHERAKLFAQNILLRAYSHNFQAYGSSAAFVDSLIFDGNVLADGGERNFLLGCDNIAHSPTVENNVMYFDAGRADSTTMFMSHTLRYSPGDNRGGGTGQLLRPRPHNVQQESGHGIHRQHPACRRHSTRHGCHPAEQI
jgi:hypothetical protein